MALSAHDELILLRKRARRRLVGAVVLVSVSSGVLWNVVGRLPDQQMRPESVEIASEASGATGEAVLPPAVNVASAAAAASKLPASAAAAVPAAKPTSTQLPANLNSVDEEPPAPTAKPAAPVLAAAAVGAVAAGQASKPAPAVSASQSLPHEPAKKKVASKPAAVESKPAPIKHKQPDPAAILAGHFDDESPAPATTVKKGERQAEKVDNAGNAKSVIQLAALSDPVKADALKSKLSGLGVAAHFSKVETSKGEVTRVRVGPFASRAEAEATLRKLSQAGVSGIIVSK